LELEAEIDQRKKTEEKLSTLLNSIPEEVWLADTQKKFTLANPAALHEFGYTAIDKLVVESFVRTLEVYRSDRTPRPADEAPSLRALKGETITNQEEIVKTPASGELRYRQVSASPVKDVWGKIIGSVSVVRDVTQHRKAEEALRESEEKWGSYEYSKSSPIELVNF
jgi:PAS domain S-box-containing protein